VHCGLSPFVVREGSPSEDRQHGAAQQCNRKAASNFHAMRLCQKANFWVTDLTSAVMPSIRA
jgi:hypothetical protein